MAPPIEKVLNGNPLELTGTPTACKSNAMSSATSNLSSANRPSPYPEMLKKLCIHHWNLHPQLLNNKLFLGIKLLHRNTLDSQQLTNLFIQGLQPSIFHHLKRTRAPIIKNSLLIKEEEGENFWNLPLFNSVKDYTAFKNTNFNSPKISQKGLKGFWIFIQINFLLITLL